MSRRPRVRAAPEAGDGLPAGRRPFALAAIILGSSLAFIDGSIVAVALPAIQGDLHAGPGQIQWVVNGYLLALGALVLVGGAAGDRYGRRGVFVAGVLLFTAASLACGLADTVETLIASRVVQGVGAALLVPTALALIPVCFEARERGRAFGIWAGASALAAAGGPVLGGWLTDAVSWRAVFLINAPVALVAIGLAVYAVPESRDRQAGPPDWPGAALATAALGLLGWALSAAVDWGAASPRFWGALAAAAVAAALFVAVERRVRAPMLPLALFRRRAFSGVNLATFALYLALSGSLYLIPFEWMRVDGRSAGQVGLGLLPFAVVLAVGSPLMGRAAGRLGPRPFMIVGPAAAAVGLLLLAWPEAGADYWTGWLPGLLTLAAGMAITVAPLTTALFEAVGGEQTGVASGVNNAAARVGGLVATALLTLVVSLTFAAEVGGDPAAANDRLAAVMGGGGGEAGLVSEEERQAFRTGFQIAMAVCAAFAFAAAAIAAATVPPKAGT